MKQFILGVIWGHLKGRWATLKNKHLGSMFWSQFSAIFDNFLTIFGEKNGVFLKNQCYDQNFASYSFVLSQKY
jgi:hypothetical protein